MDRCRFEALFRILTETSGSRRQLTGGLLAAVVSAAPALTGDITRARKKRKKKKKEEGHVPSGRNPLPEGLSQLLLRC